MSDDPESWACRLAERLPSGDIQRLARASVTGEAGVRRLRSTTGSVIVRDACDQLTAWFEHADPMYVSGLLAGAASALSQARRRQSVSVVWTGPESGVTSSRLTSATVTGLIGEARSSILLVSYATAPDPSLDAALADAVARGVAVTFLAERHGDNPSYIGSDTPFPTVDAVRLHWPLPSRPAGAALHAKVIVVDESVALVGSANLTGRAMETNFECGILLRGGAEPKAIRDHVVKLYSAGVLRRLSPPGPEREQRSVPEKRFDQAPVEGFEAGDGIPLDYAWPDRKIAVCSDLSDGERGGLEAEGWRILPDDPDVVNAALREAA
jgi:hypothetical protein